MIYLEVFHDAFNRRVKWRKRHGYPSLLNRSTRWLPRLPTTSESLEKMLPKNFRYALSMKEWMEVVASQVGRSWSSGDAIRNLVNLINSQVRERHEKLKKGSKTKIKIKIKIKQKSRRDVRGEVSKRRLLKKFRICAILKEVLNELEVRQDSASTIADPLSGWLKLIVFVLLRGNFGPFDSHLIGETTNSIHCWHKIHWQGPRLLCPSISLAL